MHVDLWIVELQVTVDVAQAGDAFHRLLQCARGLAERFEIVALQDVLVIAAAVKAADADRRTVLEKNLQQRNDLEDRKCVGEGQRGAVRLDHGGRRKSKKKKKQ